MRSRRIAEKLTALAISISTLTTSGNAMAWTGLEGPPSPTWRDVAVPYHVNRASFPANMADVTEARIRGGFASWSEPNCTFFLTQLAGDLPDGTYDANDGKNVLLWINKPNVWPKELGPQDSVIGVTLPTWSKDEMGNLVMNDADIIFNNIGFCWYDFDPKNPGMTCSGGKPVDMLSILTHEQGHFLGLGHTSVSGATMEPAYLGGNALASLEQDDIDGVCALYPIGGISSPKSSCDVCRGNAAKNDCLVSAKACTSTCLNFGECLHGCPKNNQSAYDACAMNCAGQFPDGVAVHAAYSQCVCDLCAKPCATRCFGPDGAGGVGDSWDDPSIHATGSCGCTMVGHDEQTEFVMTLGVLCAATARRRRRV